MYLAQLLTAAGSIYPIKPIEERLQRPLLYAFRPLKVIVRRGHKISSALDKLLGQLGIYATWLSSIAYLQKQLRILYIFYATFLAVITYLFLLNEAIANLPTYLLSSSAFLSIKLADFIIHEANLNALLTLVARIHFAKFSR